jgi:uncharacterized membrane protein YhaH (DUF805 family)
LNPTTLDTRPDSDTTDIRGTIRIFSPEGRIGRVRYIAYNVVMGLLSMLAIALLSAAGTVLPQSVLSPIAGIVMLIVYGAMFVVGFFFIIQRIHDFDASGWWALLTLFPLVNMFFAFVLLVVPGTRGQNRFGPRPPRNSAVVIIIALLAPLYIAGLITAFSVPVFEHFQFFKTKPARPLPVQMSPANKQQFM